MAANYTRRELLKLTGTATVGTTMLDVTAAAADSNDDDNRYDYEFDTVIDVVEAGADPTGEEPIDDLLHELAGDNTLLTFPEGRYKINQFRNYDGEYGSFDPNLYNRYENFGLKGAGSGKTFLVPREGQGTDKYGSGYFDRLWFELRYGGNYLVEGFTLDFTAPQTGSRFQLVPTGGFVMRDVNVKGVTDGGFGPFLFWVLDPDAYGLVENVRAPDGSDAPVGELIGGMYVSKLTKGTITVRNCHVEGFEDNGLYASNPSAPARIRVEGGLFKNNNIAQVRLGTPGSYVKNARVEVTKKIDTYYTINMRGIRAADGPGVSVTNCDVVMSGDAPSDGGIVMTGSAPGVSVKNTRIRVDSPYTAQAILGKSANDDLGDTFKNVDITGDANGDEAPAVELIDRPGAEFENVRIRQTGEDRDGIVLQNSDASISNSVIDVTGEAIVADHSDVSTKNIQ
jgi:hypothetical protein